jgi:uridine kinase
MHAACISFVTVACVVQYPRHEMTSLDLLIRSLRASRAPAGVATRIIAIDGPGGAGKTTLATLCATELRASVVHTDDFASWDNPINWWPELLNRVLKPLAAGNAARYEPTAWGGDKRPPVVIEAGGTVVLEGVTASRSAFRPYLAYTIWIETNRAVRLERGIARDGENAREQWQRWMTQEDSYIATEQPAEHADLVLRGDDDLWQ